MIDRDGDIRIRDLRASDPAYFADEERRQGWHADERKLNEALRDAAKAIAVSISDMVYFAVGLRGGYGSAQRMYVKRGYIPDGTGAWYGDAVCEPCSA